MSVFRIPGVLGVAWSELLRPESSTGAPSAAAFDLLNGLLFTFWLKL